MHVYISLVFDAIKVDSVRTWSNSLCFLNVVDLSSKRESLKSMHMFWENVVFMIFSFA